tara:strand:- start:43 stop:336 length:294 start_codon:yes stop_codon:yes gene_type:complete
MASYINLETITFEAFCELQALDKTFVGTPNYMGVAYFWGSNGCKHYLREVSVAKARKIHTKWLELGLDLTGETLEHYRVIGEVTGLPVPTTQEELER